MPERIEASALANDPSEVDASASADRAPSAVEAAGASAVQRMLVETAYSALNLRSSPALGENVVGKIARHSTVQAEGSQKDGFAEVRDQQGQTGWASLKYLRPEGASHAPAARGAKPEPTHAEHAATKELQAPLPVQARDATRIPVTPAAVSAIHTAALPKDSHKQQSITGDAFVKGPGDQSDIDPLDVAQGQLGDCYLLSSMAAVARANPELIRKLIKPLDAHTYEVTLYAKEHFWSARSPQKIVINDEFPVDANGAPVYAREKEQGKDGPELWVMLIEKAYATFEGKYTTIEGGFGSTGLNLLLAGGGTDYKTSDFTTDELGKRVDEALRTHHPITTGTDQDTIEWLYEEFPKLPSWFVTKQMEQQKKLGAVGGHEYSIASVDVKGRRVKIQNPWGFDHLDLSWDEYKAVFNSFSIGAI